MLRSVNEMKKGPKAITKSKIILINVKWFKDQIKRVGLSQRQIAKIWGINQAVISHMFSGKRRITFEEAVKWAEILKVPFEDVAINAGLKLPATIITASGESPLRALEIKGWVDGQLSIHWSATSLGTAPNPTGRSDVAVLQCRTTGGPFEGMDAALLYYFADAKGIDSDPTGKLCVVKIAGADTQDQPFVLRVVKRGYETGKHNLCYPNGTLKEESVILELATPILWMKL